VALSRRLRAILRERWMAEGQPVGDVENARMSPSTARRRFVEVMTAAGVTGHKLKDLRDTYASQLISAGIQLGYVSEQLGHSGIAITSRHYARWCGSNGYREPVHLVEGELPADLLSRMVSEHQGHHSGHHFAGVAGGSIEGG
jgi:integrase